LPVVGWSAIGRLATILRTDRTAQAIIAGLAFLQNLRGGDYEIATETIRAIRLLEAVAEQFLREGSGLHPVPVPCAREPS
jgi:hypothetical protein